MVSNHGLFLSALPPLPGSSPLPLQEKHERSAASQRIHANLPQGLQVANPNTLPKRTLPGRGPREQNEPLAEVGSKKKLLFAGLGGKEGGMLKGYWAAAFPVALGAKRRAFDLLSRPGLAARTCILSPAVTAGFLARSSPIAESKKQVT